jgi:catecholate siderophore receptor
MNPIVDNDNDSTQRHIGIFSKRSSSRKRKKNRKKKRNKSTQRGPKYWIALGAMGAMAAYTGLGSNAVTLAYGPGSRNAIVYLQDQAQWPARRFDIPPGPMEKVLSTFRSLTGWRVTLANDEINNISSPGVSGVYTVEQALKQLLAGTGVTYRSLASDAMILEVSGPSASVEVTGVTVITSPKYTEPLRDVPQTITVIPRSVIDEQGATTLRDVLRNVPGLTLAAGEGGTPAGDNLTLRGFSARNDVFVDGVRDLGPQSRDPFNLEQVEVVKGPASTYSGRGSTGGSINMVSKSPGSDSFYGFTFNLGTDRTRRFTADINAPLERLGLGKRAAFRINILAHESGVAGRDDAVENKRWGVAPSLAFGLGTRTRLTISYFKLKQNNISDYGIPWVPVTNNVLVDFRDKPAPVPRDTFYGLRNRDFEKLNSDLATAKFERDFSDTLTLRHQFRYGRSTRDSIATPPRFASNDSLAINRELRSWLTKDEIWDNQTDLRARFSTGKIEHSLVGGLTFTREDNQRRFRTAPNMLTTLFDPNPDDTFTGAITLSPLVGDITGNSFAAYAFDTMKMGRKFELSGGLRWDYFDAEGVSVGGTPQALIPIARIDRMLSWRASAVYKPRQQGSIYAAYGTSLNPSLEGLSYNPANAAIDPEKTYTFEVGSKWDLFKERLSVSVAGFRVNKTNARTPGLLPDDPPQVLDGEQRVYGAELGASGSITRELRVFAAYTYLDSEIVKSNTPAEVGREIQNTPKHSLSLWTSYQFPRRFTVGGGARFVDDRFGNNINTRRVDGYWTIDAMASYPLTNHVDLRLNLYNLNDAYYFDRLGGGHLVPGAGRSVNVSLGFRF